MYQRIFPARSRYYNFGLNLGLSVAKLEEIKYDVNDQSDKGLYQVLNSWVQKNARLSWKEVADALKAPSVGVTVTISPN